MHTNSKMFFKLKHKHHNSIGITLQQSCREQDSEVKTPKVLATHKFRRFLISWLNLQRLAVQIVVEVFFRKLAKRNDCFEILLQQTTSHLHDQRSGNLNRHNT